MRHRPVPRPTTFAVLLAAGSSLLVLAGCGLSLPQRQPAPSSTPARASTAADAESTRQLLEWLGDLRAATPARQAELVAEARASAESTPTTALRLRLGLALAMPGQSGTDPVAARRHLSELVARPEWLLPGERVLAQLFLRELDERQVLAAENQRLQQEGTARASERVAALNKRLQAEVEENNRLRRQLDEAQKKLEAVMQLERNNAPAPAPRPGRKP